MSIAKISIKTSSDIGRIVVDGVPGLIGAAKTGDTCIKKATQVSSVAALDRDDGSGKKILDKGSSLYAAAASFFKEAGDGASLWVYGVAAADATLAKLVPEVKKFFEDTNKAITIMGVLPKEATGATYTNGLLGSISANLGKLQDETVRDTLARFTVLLGVDKIDKSKVSNLTDFTSGGTYTNLSVFVTDIATATGSSNGLTIGSALGRAISNGYSDSIASVEKGVLKSPPTEVAGTKSHDKVSYYDTSDPVPEDVLADIAKKGYVTHIKYPNFIGEYFSNSQTLAGSDNAFNSLERSRVLNAIIRLISLDFTNKFNSKIEVDGSGQLTLSFINLLSSTINDNIIFNFAQPGHISAFSFKIPGDQDALSTGEIKTELSIVPVGTLKSISVDLTFKTSL